MKQNGVEVRSNIARSLLAATAVAFVVVSALPHAVLYAMGRKGLIRVEHDELFGDTDIFVLWDKVAFEKRA